MLVVEAGIQYGWAGQVGTEEAGTAASPGNRKLVYRSGAAVLEVGTRRQAEERRGQVFGGLADCFRAMQTILAWNTVYDGANGRVITPVSRLWNRGWGGFVLFDWDTYFAGYMCSWFDKDLAYANMVEITKAISEEGFIPNYQAPFGNYSWDRSEPPVGAILVLDMYKRYREKWFLEEVYDELLAWNRWWAAQRAIKGYLAWGSDKVPDSLRTIDQFNIVAARLESGLDNSPMYDSIPFNETTHTMEKYGKSLAGLWDEEKGIFVNRRTDTDQKSYRLSPTLFYPLLAKVATQAQAERMMKEHYCQDSKRNCLYPWFRR